MVSVPIPKLTVTYFPFAARAEPLRLAAAIGKVAFTNDIVEIKDFPVLKSTLPLGKVPVLSIETRTDGGPNLCVPQSMAILRYIGTIGGLYPANDPVAALQVDSYMDTAAEACAHLELAVMGPVRKMIADEPWTSEESLLIRQRMRTDKEKGLPLYFSYFEKELEKKNGGWLVGESVTIADVTLYRLSSWIGSGLVDGISPEFLDAYPKVSQHKANIDALPQVVQWREKYPMPYETFDFCP